MPTLRRSLFALLTAAAAMACGSLVDPEGNGGGAVSPAVRGLRLDQSTLALAVGETRQVNVTAVNVAGQPVPPPPGQSIRLSSSDAAIFTVSATGQVRGVAAGAAVLRAELGALSIGAAVTVSDNVDRLEVVSGSGQTAAPSTLLPTPLVVRAVSVGGAPRAGLTVTFTPDAGSTAPATAVTGTDGTASTRWTLSAAAGAQTLTASATGFRSATFTASAVARPIVSIELDPVSATLTDVGQSRQFTARALDAGGQVITGVTFSWTSSRTDVAIVSSTGLVTAVAAGSTRITAAAGTVSGGADVAVTVPQPAPRLLLEPASLTASATQTSTTAPQVLPAVQVREATTRPLTDLGALTTDAPVYAAGQPTGWITNRALNTTSGALVLTVDPVNLPPGTYSATVPVRAALASNSPQPLAVQLTVTAASVPRIVVNPVRWDAARPARATDVTTLDVAVTNGGSGTLNGLTAEVAYTAGQATGWLTATVGAAAPATLRLTASAAALDAGVYDATVTVRSSVAGVAAVTVPVQLTVSATGRLRLFRDGQELPLPTTSDSFVISVGGLYGTADFPLNFALADAAGQRLRPTSPAAPTYFGGVPGGLPSEAWLQPVATDSGALLRILHTPALRVGYYQSATTVQVPGFAPIIFVVNYFNSPRLVALSDAADTTSVVSFFEFALDGGTANTLAANPLLRQIGGWCRRGEYRGTGPGGGALPAWLRVFNASASVQTQTLAMLAEPSVVAPGATVSVIPQIRHEVADADVFTADCLLPSTSIGQSLFFVQARAPSYRLATNVDTLVLVNDPAEGGPSGIFDLDVVPAVATGPCPSFQVPQTGVQGLLDPADEADGLDINTLGRGAALGFPVSTRPTGVTQRVTVNTTGLRGGRTYVYGLAYSATFRCQDGIQPYPDTLWVRFSVPGGGTGAGTLRVRGRGLVQPLPDGVQPFEGYIAAVNGNTEAAPPTGFPDYNISVYYEGSRIPDGDQIVLDTVIYGPGASGWYGQFQQGSNVGDTVAFFGVGLASPRPVLPRGEYRATVRLRSTETGQTVSFPMTYAVGGQDGFLTFTQLAAGSQSGCGIAGNPAAPALGNQLFCWGQMGPSLVPADNPAGYWHERAGLLARAPFPMSDSALQRFNLPSAAAPIVQIRTASRNLVMLVESLRDDRRYVVHGGSLGIAFGTTSDFDFGGLRPLLNGGSLVAARSVALAQQGATACAVGEGGQPFCWGQTNLSLGVTSGTITTFSTPSEVDSVVTSGGHACAWAVGGNAWCWGANNDGQLGRGVFAGSPPYPVAQVPGLTDVRSMSVGPNTTCARTGTGFFCWGSNQDGIIYGRALGTRFNTPQAVTPPVLDLQFEDAHACGRSSTTAGALFCWGVESAPGGAVSGPVGTRPVSFGYREVLWPVTITQYEVGPSSTCYASFSVWRCAGSTGEFTGTGGGSVAVTTPRPILGQQPALIGNTVRSGDGFATRQSRQGTDRPGVLNAAGQWLRGLFRRDEPAERRMSLKQTPPTAGARISSAQRRSVWKVLPERQLGTGLPMPASARLPAPRIVRTEPLADLLRRPTPADRFTVRIERPGAAGSPTTLRTLRPTAPSASTPCRRFSCE